jgi:hypothetical protein
MAWMLSANSRAVMLGSANVMVLVNDMWNITEPNMTIWGASQELHLKLIPVKDAVLRSIAVPLPPLAKGTQTVY